MMAPLIVAASVVAMVTSGRPEGVNVERMGSVTQPARRRLRISRHAVGCGEDLAVADGGGVGVMVGAEIRVALSLRENDWMHSEGFCRLKAAAPR